MALLFDKFVECFENYDPQTFRALHHEEFLFVREAELSTLDEHCAIIDELAVKQNWDWHKIAELVHENQFVMECRWTDGDEIVTSVDMKKDGKIWRGIVSRTPRKKAA